MHSKSILLICLLVSITSVSFAQLIPSDTTIININNRDITIIEHNDAFPFVHQFEFNDRLFFCDEDGVYEQLEDGINFIQGPEDDHFPFMVVEDVNSPSGYQIINATLLGNSSSSSTDLVLVLLGGGFSPLGTPLDTIVNINDFIRNYGPSRCNFKQQLRKSIYPPGDPFYGCSLSISSSRINGYVATTNFVRNGENPTTLRNVLENRSDIINFSDLTIDALLVNEKISSSTLINGEQYLHIGQVVKFNKDNATIEPIKNDFNAYCVGNWKDQLVMMGSNKLTIGLSDYYADISDILEEVKDILFGTIQMKVDADGHLWFGKTGSFASSAVEVILDEGLLNDFIHAPNVDLNRYTITTDTTLINEMDENFIVIQHTVFDQITNQYFNPKHFIDIDGELLVGSEIGYLRRQADGLVPVITPEDNSVAYYLTKSDSQLHPYNQFLIDAHRDGKSLKELVNNEVSAIHNGIPMIQRLMNVGDGRKFTIRDHFLDENDFPFTIPSPPTDLEVNKHLTGWGKLNEDHVIEEKSEKVVVETSAYHLNIWTTEISFNDSVYDFEHEQVISPQGPPYSSTDMIRNFLDVEFINDSIHIFPQESLYNDNPPSNFNPITEEFEKLNAYSIDEFYTNNPIAVEFYKEEPIFLLKDHLKIGFPNVWTDLYLDGINFSLLTEMQITNDHHIWLFGDDADCYEIIREEEQGIVTELRENCFYENIVCNLIQSCTDTTEAIIEIGFTDNENGNGEYNIFVNQELVLQIADTTYLTLSLSTDLLEEDFEIYIQNINDPLCKQKVTANIKCILDQDGDGFSNDVDCDDFNPTINPAAIEIPDNQIDEDCNGSDLVLDQDGDGFNFDVDCDDNNASINPDAEEIPDNGIDEDCNGSDLTAVHDLNGTKLSVYPNPVTDILSIDLDQSTTLSYRIISLDGKLIMAGTLTNNLTHNINIESLREGLYFIELTDLATMVRVTESLVKQ